MVLLQEEADKKGIPVKLFPGNEIFYRHGLGELLELGKIRTCLLYTSCGCGDL